jgi:hypothetical protein
LEYLGVLITGSLATVWTAPVVVVAAAILIFISLSVIALLEREIGRLD